MKIRIVVKDLHPSAKKWITDFIRQYEEVLEIYDEPQINALVGAYNTMLKCMDSLQTAYVIEGTRGVMVNPEQTVIAASQNLIKTITANLHRRLKDVKKKENKDEFGL
jgi:hypothetical protein